MVPLRFVLGVSLLWVLVAPLGARGESPSALEPDAARDEFFSYPLRSGESLNDVARIFRVPAQELATINRITDPNRLQLGQIIRVPIPPLNEERRKELVKLVKKFAEEGKIAVRNVRRDAIEHLKRSEKAEHFSEDERKRAEADVQKMTDRFIKDIDTLVTVKEKEIMEV